MRCREARDLLTRDLRPDPEPDPALTTHLASCPDCERFAECWTAARAALAGRRSTVLPDAGFAARVTARLGAATDPFAWAARRLVPVSLALTLVLGAWCLLVTPMPTSLADELADGDLMSWVVSGDEEQR